MLNSKQKQAAKLLRDATKKYYMFWGGSRSGKTWQICRFIIIRAAKYPGSKHLICRYSFANAKKTVWLHTIWPMLRDLERAGKCRIVAHEGICHFANGSTIILGGLEPSKIDSVLAAQYGTIFITEANENKYMDIENLFSRLNDTSTDKEGKQIPLKFLIDLNPTVTRNWTNILFRRGIDPATQQPRSNYHEFADIHFKPEDNVANLSPGYIDSLKALSPGKRKRFYDGLYGAFEGLVYTFDEDEHIVDDFAIPKHWPKARGIDFGFVHPFVCLWAAQDPANETIYIYREYIVRGLTVSKHSKAIKPMSEGESYEWTVADHDAEDRATLHENDISTWPASKSVEQGIDRVTDMLDFTDEKRSRLRVFRSCVNTINGFYSYRWKDNATKDRQVVKEDDDEMDVVRYMIMQFYPVEGVQVYENEFEFA